jgi:hypothetical protein
MTGMNKLAADRDKHSENTKNKNSEVYLQKYSKGVLAEAVLIAGKPVFLISKKGVISVQASINAPDNSIVKPLEAYSYLSKPYSFVSEGELKACIERAKLETLDSLYTKVKSKWKKYIDGDDFHISICAADTVYTYWQDMIGLTHYLFFIGDNTSGKSNNLQVIHILSYRNFMSSDVTSANVYQFFGGIEEGQGTLCIDEADQIDSNIDLMRIFKNGYTTGFPVARVDTSQGRKQYRFFTFGFKAFSAERLPDSVTAKGFRQRIVPLPCTYGIPQYDISEILNPAGEREHEDLIAELYELRNTLLIYRLLHYHEIIPDIRLNLAAREKQLFKPVMRIFQNTDTLRELLLTISKYVSERRQVNANTLHAFLYKLVTDLIKAQGTPELESTLIWNTLTNVLPGDVIPNRRLSYESSEFGTISQKGITETLIQVFGAQQSSNRRDKRRLRFDVEKLKRLSRIYDLSIDVRVGTSVTDVADVTDIGLDRYAIEAEGQTKKNEGQIAQDQKKENSTNNYNNNHNNNINTTSNITTEASSDRLQHTNNPSQASQVSPLIQQQAASHVLDELKDNTSSSTTLADIVAISNFLFSCYYCDGCKTNDRDDYERHIVNKHPKKVAYPGKEDLQSLGLRPQGKTWEIVGS